MKCKDCKWWDDLAPEEKDNEKVGQCHRNAPQPKLLYTIYEDVPDTENICSYSVDWPFAEYNDWCGEWVEK